MYRTISHRPDEEGYRRARTDLGGRLHLHQRQRRGCYQGRAPGQPEIGCYQLGTIEMDPDMKIRVYGGDVAVAINRVTLKGQYSGKATSGQFQTSIVCVKMPSGWQLVCNQITPVTSP